MINTQVDHQKLQNYIFEFWGINHDDKIDGHCPKCPLSSDCKFGTGY